MTYDKNVRHAHADVSMAPWLLIAGSVLLCLGVCGCTRSDRHAVDAKQQILQLENARLFNLSIQAPVEDIAPLPEVDARSFIRCLRSMEYDDSLRPEGTRLIATVSMQSGKNPLLFIVSESQVGLLVTVDDHVFIVRDDADLRAWIDDHIP